ncbi:MAG: DNA topoisomerase VI subunit B [Candidatus Hadarchaeales archaeon]
MVRVAEEIFREFKEHTVSEFFRKNAAMLGYTGKIRSLTTVIHEAVTNSIDAAEEAGILPKIKVIIEKASEDPEHLRVTVEDNATGIPESFISHVFGKMLAGTKLHRFMQQRGQQGIGISGAVMFSQMTTGKPVKVITSTGKGEIVEAHVMIDVERNEGKIVKLRKLKGKWRGTRVELELKDIVYIRSRYGPFNYLRMTAVANPHVHITLVEPDGNLTVFENAVEEVPKPPEPVLPHPLGLLPDDLLSLAKRTSAKSIGSFLSSELEKVSREKAREVCRMAGVPENKNPKELTWEEAERIVKAFKEVKIQAPSSQGLRPIGAQNIESGLKQIYNPEFVHVVQRPPKVYRGGIPFQVEVGIAYGGSAGKRTEEGEGETGIEVIRFANRAPLIFDQGGCAIMTAVNSIDWRRYGVDPANAPITLFVNISSVYVPYTSAGKQSIADEPEIVAEIRSAIMDAARELRAFLNRKIRLKERREKAMIFEKYLPVIAKKAARLAGKSLPDISKVLTKILGGKNVKTGEEEKGS